MSNLLFTDLPVEQQETIVGGTNADSAINSVTVNPNTILDAVNSSLSTFFNLNNIIGGVNGLLNSFLPI